jgi:hypothetical protein
VVGNLLWSQTTRAADYFARWIELKEERMRKHKE